MSSQVGSRKLDTYYTIVFFYSCLDCLQVGLLNDNLDASSWENNASLQKKMGFAVELQESLLFRDTW